MFQPVIYHNSGGPNSYGSSFDLSPDEDVFSMEGNWENGLVYILIILYLSVKYYFIDFQLLYPCLLWLHVISH